MRKLTLMPWLIGVAVALGSPAPLLADDRFNRLPPGDRLSLVLLVVVIGFVIALGLLAIQLLYSVLRAPALRQGSDLLRRRPAYALGLGVLVLLVLGGAVALAQLVPEPGRGLLVLALILVALYLAIPGVTMVNHAIGEQVHANLNSRYVGSSFMAVLTGGVLTLLIGCVPLLGQLIQFVILLIGLGAATVGLAGRRAVRRRHSRNRGAMV